MTVEDTLMRLQDVQDEMRALRKREDDIKAELAEVEWDDYVLPNGYVATIQPSIRFNAATAKKNLTPEQFEAICKKRPDAALAKALLDEDYHLCQSANGNKITFKEAN